jgi:hypothetical protein
MVGLQIMQGGQSYWFPQMIAVLLFSCSCLVSSSPRKLGQFSFECGLWFRRSALPSTTCPALEVACCCVCLLGFPCWVFISLPRPLSLGQVVFQLPPLLSVFYYSLLFVFQFCGQFSFECCSLAKEMSSVIHYLPCFGDWLIACPISVFTAFLMFVYW